MKRRRLDIDWKDPIGLMLAIIVVLVGWLILYDQNRMEMQQKQIADLQYRISVLEESTHEVIGNHSK